MSWLYSQAIEIIHYFVESESIVSSGAIQLVGFLEKLTIFSYAQKCCECCPTARMTNCTIFTKSLVFSSPQYSHVRYERCILRNKGKTSKKNLCLWFTGTPLFRNMISFQFHFNQNCFIPKM